MLWPWGTLLLLKEIIGRDLGGHLLERAIGVGGDQHRRARTTPLTNEEKRARIEAELKADPARSDNAIAKAVGVAQNFVGRTRARLESGGVISEITPTERASRTGKIGEGQRRRHAEKRERAEAVEMSGA
jgi:hypothetical protein